jgi:hypothetical protein
VRHDEVFVEHKYDWRYPNEGTLFVYDSNAQHFRSSGCWDLLWISSENNPLQTFPSSFNQLRLNVTMNKKDFTLAELINESIIAKSILKTKVSANIAHASTFKPKGNMKKK